MKTYIEIEKFLKDNNNYIITHIVYIAIKTSDLISNKNYCDVFKSIYIEKEKYNIIAKKYNLSNKALYNLRIKFTEYFINLKNNLIK